MILKTKFCNPQFRSSITLKSLMKEMRSKRNCTPTPTYLCAKVRNGGKIIYREKKRK